MIELNANTVLDNGAEVKYYVITEIIVSLSNIHVRLAGFTNKKYFDKSVSKTRLINTQQEKIDRFNILASDTNLTEEKRQEIVKLQEEINTLGDEIATLLDYTETAVVMKELDIPYTENITDEYIIEEIKKAEDLKDITLNTEGE